MGLRQIFSRAAPWVGVLALLHLANPAHAQRAGAGAPRGGGPNAMPADLMTYDALFNDAAAKVHHVRLNDDINKYCRSAQNLRFRHAQAIGREASGESRGPGFAEEAAALVKSGAGTLDRLKEALPVVAVRIEGGALQARLEGAKTIAANRREFLLIEVLADEGAPRGAIEVSEGQGSGIRVPPRTAACQPGAARWTLAEIQEDQPGVRILRMRLTLQPRTDATPPSSITVEGEMTVLPTTAIGGEIFDAATGERVPARVYAWGVDERYAFPRGGGMEKPSNYDIAYGYFYGDGRFSARLPAGKARIRIERGFEYEPLIQDIEVQQDAPTTATFRLARWVDMTQRGWWSVDSHMHYVRMNWYEEGDYDALDMQKRAEDINVGHLLPLMHWWKQPVNIVDVRSNKFPPRKGLLPEYSHGRYVTAVGEEMRNDDLYGHLVLWNIEGLVKPVSTGWMGGPNQPDYPSNTGIAAMVHAQKGFVSPAHDVVQEVPVMAALGAIDMIDLHSPNQWYNLLNCGFRLPAMIGSDYPANRMGFERGYVYTGKSEFHWEEFLRAMFGGRTFVTSGPVISVEADGKIPGDVLELKGDAPHKARVRAVAQWREPLQRIEIVHNGVVIKQLKPESPQKTLELDETIELPGKGWIAARCSANNLDNWWPVEGIAHTSPVYLDDGTGRFSTPDAARAMLKMSENTLTKIQARGKFDTPEQKAGVVATFEKGITIYRDMAGLEAAPASAPAGGR